MTHKGKGHKVHILTVVLNYDIVVYGQRKQFIL